MRLKLKSNFKLLYHYRNFLSMATPVKFQIEKTNPESHCNDLEKMILELAEFERMPNGPRLKAENLKADLENGYCHSYVAVLTEKVDQFVKNSVIGYLIYYYAYSTWEGRYLFVEDIYVKPTFRRFGIGSALWKMAAKVAHDQHLPRIEWNVLAWNETAIKFYDRLGAIDLYKKESWVRFRLEPSNIEKLARDS